ncbi:MAG: hypothetical protein LQ342_001847 [Letrouitia transgressa]|nr:MAG: hypothetical protein LQ342_001847 [Letrouitia transgressa]
MAVGFGFSLGDIITVSRLAREIYENGFTRAQAADVKYAQFRQDIKSLADSLAQLERIVNNASDQGAYTHEFDPAIRILPEVTGDFRRTVKDCQTLLYNHAGLEQRRANIRKNLEWWSFVETDVTNLRERVKFHVSKISFIAKPFQIQLLLGIQHDVRQLRRELAVLTNIISTGVRHDINESHASYLPSISIPADILTRFTLAVNIKRPSCFNNNSDWPLREGFDALVFHYSKSTIEFNSRPELGETSPDGQQYLNLLKCIWIIDQLKASTHFREAGPDSLWADYMRSLEDKIRIQVRRLEAQQMKAPSVDVISILPDGCYNIWIDEAAPLRSLKFTKPEYLEEKILELNLPQLEANKQSSLTVFRKSDTDFHIITTTKMKDNPGYHNEKEFDVDMTSSRLIPAYAVSTNNTSPPNNLILCNERGLSPRLLSLKDFASVGSLQRALMGYRIHHLMSGFTWCINGSSAIGDSGTGRLQLWQPKPLPAMLSDLEALPINNQSFSDLSPQLPKLDLGNSMFSSSPAELTVAQTQSPQFANSNAPNVATPKLSTSPPTSHRSSMFSRTVSIDTTSSSEFMKRSTLASSATPVSHTSTTSLVSGPHNDGTELVRPDVPALMIFTVCEERYTFLYVKRKHAVESPNLILTNHLVDTHIFINPQSCPCKSKTKKNLCTRTVLESNDKKKPFTVYKFCANKPYGEGLYSWDLGLFRYPRRPELNKVKTVKNMNSLGLAFATVQDKDEFIRELAELENVRTTDYNRYTKDLLERRRRADNHGRRQS